MWEPVGPLPAHVYWKRRWLALASVIAFFVVAGFSLAVLTAGPSDPGPTNEATTPVVNRTDLPPGSTTPSVPSAGPAVPSAAPSAGPAPDATGAAGTTTPVSGTSDPAALSATGIPAGTTSPSGTPSAGVEGGPETPLQPDTTPRVPVAVPPTSAAPPTGPPACTNDMIAVSAEIDSPTHKVGDRPQLRLVVVNITGQACVRDLDGALQEIVVWDRPVQKRLWSSNDCVNPSTQDLRTLVPGQPVAFAVTWSGLSSVPGCTAPRTRIPAGDYTLLTRVADKISGPTYFTLTPA
ncbi:hypothetical protein GCM10009836_18500 [Pseudonocardia ailaonensis]|uniref:MucR family transcriptional regulator n=1 Tax=Pseudonocardia ailaonensis TaxID=367279 RepID=A0ABN2MWL7_9PSEU